MSMRGREREKQSGDNNVRMVDSDYPFLPFITVYLSHIRQLRGV